MGIALLDSSTVVAFLDRDDALHGAADAAVRTAAAEHSLVVSLITVAEVLTGVRLGHHDEAPVRRFFNRAISARLPIDEPIAERAAQLRSTHRALRMPDALILATAETAADLVLTGDERWLAVKHLRCELRYIVAAAKPRR